MSFRMGMVLGLGAGYVLGAKAGRERYEQIMDVVARVAPAERAHHVLELAQDRLHLHPHPADVIPPSPN